MGGCGAKPKQNNVQDTQVPANSDLKPGNVEVAKTQSKTASQQGLKTKVSNENVVVSSNSVNKSKEFRSHELRTSQGIPQGAAKQSPVSSRRGAPGEKKNFSPSESTHVQISRDSENPDDREIEIRLSGLEGKFIDQDGYLDLAGMLESGPEDDIVVGLHGKKLGFYKGTYVFFTKDIKNLGILHSVRDGFSVELWRCSFGDFYETGSKITGKSIVFSPSHEIVLSNKKEFLAMPHGQVILTINDAQKMPVDDSDIAFSKDDKYCCFKNASGRLSFADFEKRVVYESKEKNQAGVVTTDSKYVIGYAQDLNKGMFNIYKIDTSKMGNELELIKQNKLKVLADFELITILNETQYITVSKNSDIQIWDINREGFIFKIEGPHVTMITDLLVFPDSNYILTYDDCTLRIWNVYMRSCVKTYDLKKPIHYVSISQNGKYFVVSYADGEIIVWKSPSDIDAMNIKNLFTSTYNNFLDQKSDKMEDLSLNIQRVGSKKFSLFHAFAFILEFEKFLNGSEYIRERLAIGLRDKAAIALKENQVRISDDELKGTSKEGYINLLKASFSGSSLELRILSRLHMVEIVILTVEENQEVEMRKINEVEHSTKRVFLLERPYDKPVYDVFVAKRGKQYYTGFLRDDKSLESRFKTFASGIRIAVENKSL